MFFKNINSVNSLHPFDNFFDLISKSRIYEENRYENNDKYEFEMKKIENFMIINIANSNNTPLHKIPIITITPFYISNADFYVVLNHIKIIYSSSLFFVFYFLEHIFLVFRKHP